MFISETEGDLLNSESFLFFLLYSVSAQKSVNMKVAGYQRRRASKELRFRIWFHLAQRLLLLSQQVSVNH